MSNLLQQTLKHLQELVGSDTQNPPRAITQESDVFAYLQSNLKGFEFAFFDAGDGCISLLATRGKPELLFNFHIDTVPVAKGWKTAPHDLVLSDAKAIGLGACDIKGAAACMLAAANQTNAPLALLFSSDEEFGNSAAIKYFLKQDIVQSFGFEKVIVAEPTQSKAVLAHRGIQSAKIKFSGESGHASETRAIIDNAIHKASLWANATIEWINSQNFNFENLQGLPFNIGKVEGGIKANMIAADCEMAFGFRPLPGQSSQQLLDKMIDLSNHSESTELIPGFSGPTLPADNQNFEESINKAKSLAEHYQLEIGDAVSFWTEASLFSQAGFTSIVYGPGDIAQAHTANEWVALEQLEQVTNTYIEIINNSSLKEAV